MASKTEAENIHVAVNYCIIGAGVHGSSTSRQLGRKLQSRGWGSGADRWCSIKPGFGPELAAPWTIPAAKRSGRPQSVSRTIILVLG